VTLLTIVEAARFLRLTKRTLYQRVDIPRVRYGHRIMFVREDLEQWIRTLTEGPVMGRVENPISPSSPVDVVSSNVYHRNPLFISRRQK
jgi:excisionase family DNA binding protein